MNLVLLFKSDFIFDTSRVRLMGRRLKHVLEIHKASTGDCLEIGLENGPMGQGNVVSIDHQCLEMDVTLDRPPPPSLALNLVLALPRPKVLNRVILSATSLGIKKIWLIHTARVEKSYWQSPRLDKENIREQAILGLEQSKDTLMPEIILKKGFKPFVEDELPGIIQGTRAYVAHPGSGLACPVATKEHLTLAIGPEGGFIPYEISKLSDCGFIPVHLGNRVLRVESVLPYIIGRMFC
ncbi:MAG: 16S rRNA (uracil(1498)-N(3))-methyltransferase [Proteobacteria bacterium]|nr:16S rRNA (uracil(1498)-N(3))-methyltransferase [Pseudomonadota bacterium]